MSALRLDDRHERPLELAALAVDFDLTATESRELASHLAGCPVCARRVAALRADARALGRPLTVLPSARVDAAVSAAIAGRRAPQQPRRLLLLAGTALLLLAMLGAVAAGAAYLRSLEDRSTTITPTQPVVERSPDPSASPGVIGETWGVLPFDDAASGAVEAITFAGADLVGVGRGDCVVDSDGAGECHAAAWTAPAGGGWARAASQPGLAVGLGVVESDPRKGIYDVASGPAGLVAIGYDIDPLPGSCPLAPCTSGPAVWRSPDGRTWERVPVDFGPAVIDTFSEPIAAITAGPDGYVMVGYALGLSPAGDTEAHAAAWASPDGVTWTRAAESEDLTLGGCVAADPRQDCGGMTAVAATPAGFVAVGYRYAGGSTQSPAAWTSPDGLTWTLTMSGLDFEGSLDSVAVGPAGVVAGGMACPAKNCHGTSAVLGSDGTWTVSPGTGQAMGVVRSLAATGDTYFGLVENGSAVDLWRSEDGLAWQPVSGLPATPAGTGFRGVDLAAGSDRLVVVGWAAVGGGDSIRNISYSSPPVGVPPALPVESTPPVVAVPASALRWEQIGTIPGATITGLLAFEHGYVAYGNDDTEPFSPPTAWFSSDGQSWEAARLSRPVLNCPDWGPSGDEMVPDAKVAAGATDGQAVVLVGEEQLRDGAACAGGVAYRALTWASSDGRTWQRSDGLGAQTRAEDVWTVPGGWRMIDESRTFWRSPDGLAWNESGAIDAQLDVQSVAISGSGTHLVSGNLHGPTDDSSRFVLMTSSDGVAWEELPSLSGCEQGVGSILAPQAVDGGAWVLARSGPATCVSTDLDTWRQGALGAPRDFAIHDLARTRYGLHAFGTLDCGGCPFDAHQYVSVDGLDWTVLDDQTTPVWPIADGPAGVLGVGGEGEPGIWRLVEGPSPAVAPAP